MKALKTLPVLCSILSLFCFSLCRKDYNRSSITLRDKPVSVIESYIQGKWKLEYEKGGFCSTCTSNFHDRNLITEFASGNRIKQTDNGDIFTDTTITWIRNSGTTSNSTFIMQFYDKRGYPTNLIVDGIFNDSLQLYDYGSDPVYYHFSKVN